jgi:hypothetical protein
MDLRTHSGVIWRWRVLFAVGIALALMFTFFSYYKVSFADGLTHRQEVTWQSAEMLQLTQPGCEYCRAVPAETTNLAWLTTLTTVYAQIANGDALRRQVFLGRPRTDANYIAAPVQDPVTPGQSQFLTFAGTATSPVEAVRIARRATSTFLNYLDTQSQDAGVSRNERVVLKVVTKARLATARVVEDRKKTIPIIVFLSILVMTFVVTYALENLYPRASTDEVPADEPEAGVGRAKTSPGSPARAGAAD